MSAPKNAPVIFSVRDPSESRRSVRQSGGIARSWSHDRQSRNPPWRQSEHRAQSYVASMDYMQAVVEGTHPPCHDRPDVDW